MSEKISEENIKLLKGTNKPYLWLPSYYFPSGLPYSIIMLSFLGLMYKNYGISNTEITFFTGWLYLPWVLKPIWSAVVQMYGSNKRWLVILQSLMGISFASLIFVLPLHDFFKYSLAIFWIVAFISSTFDIAGDGLYLSALTKEQRAYYIGWTSTFYRLAMIFANGFLVALAGFLINHYSITTSYSCIFLGLGVLFILFAIYNQFILPVPEKTVNEFVGKTPLKYFCSEFIDIIVTFFNKKKIVIFLLFILFYRLAESQLSKISSLFMKDLVSVGGLGMSDIEIGVIYGTFGLIALTIGGILSGYLIYRFGLRKMIWWCVCAINLPDLVYVYMSYMQPDSYSILSSCVFVEMFGYGFGFSAFMLYLMKISEGKYKTAHYAICTAFMAIGMMVPQMFSGYIESILGYKHFFLWVMICTIPSFFVTMLIPIKKDEFKKIKK